MEPAVYRIFVYGTLLRGEPNHLWLGDATFVSTARTAPEFELVDLGEFPAMIQYGKTAISGEVFEADEATVRRLDRLEGHPDFYNRTTITLEDGQEAQTYLLRQDQVRGARRIISGDWRSR